MKKSKGSDFPIGLKEQENAKRKELTNELTLLINRLSMESICSRGQYGIRDYILAEVAVDAMFSFAKNFHLELNKRG
jgi:hypothetical protein